MGCVFAVARRKLPKRVNRKACQRSGRGTQGRCGGCHAGSVRGRAVTKKPNPRWAVDTAHVSCGRDGSFTSRRSSVTKTVLSPACGCRRLPSRRIAAAALKDAPRKRKIDKDGLLRYSGSEEG